MLVCVHSLRGVLDLPCLFVCLFGCFVLFLFVCLFCFVFVCFGLCLFVCLFWSLVANMFNPESSKLFCLNAPNWPQRFSFTGQKERDSHSAFAESNRNR